jgi:rubrerythrin
MNPLPDLIEYFKVQGKLFTGYEMVGLEEYRDFVELLDSESDETEIKAKSAPKPKKEIVEPTEWNCEICTFLNPVSDGSCGICGQGKRPSMDILIERAETQKLEAAR